MGRIAEAVFKLRTVTLTAAGATWFVLGIGVALRVVEYVQDRPLYLDEKLLRANIVGRPVFGLSGPLAHDQLAPPGFLVAERAAAWLLGGSTYALRLFPLLSAIVALVLMRDVARRVLESWVVPIAVALLAVSDELIYYASEVKQYSTDTAVALACVAMGLRLASGKLTARRVAAGLAVGATATWFSHPSAFVLAGVGSYLAGAALIRRNWGRAAAFAAMSAAWGMSFGACHSLSMRLLSPGEFMWTWWGFAFLPVPPRSAADCERVFWHVANVFVQPVGLTTPLGPLYTAMIGMGLFLIGSVSMARTRAGPWWMLAGPILFALVASGQSLYPFHGRLLYFLVPGLVVVIAEGIGAIGRAVGRPASCLVLGFLLIGPTADVLDHWVHPYIRYPDRNGDLKNDLLDYLEGWHIWPRGPQR